MRPRAGHAIRLHAIYVVLDDYELFLASVRSIYDHVDGITVLTNHDMDWRGTARSPSRITAAVLARDIDPDRKIDLIVTSETSEARARARAMDFAAPRAMSRRVQQEHELDRELDPPDYFLIVDCDEIWSGEALERAKRYVLRRRAAVYRTACDRYFKRWNYRITGHEWLITFVRADTRLRYLRTRKASLPRRAISRLPGLPDRARGALRGFHDIPADVATFHHGTYVGPRERIAQKLEAWGHADDVPANWMEEVYDRWTVDSRDFNPVYRGSYDAAVEIPVDELPVEITAQPWPADYLDH
jgi:hypothetical protein